MLIRCLVAVSATLLVSSCTTTGSEGEGEAAEGEGDGGEGESAEGEGEDLLADVPPTDDAAALERWIEGGRYLGWACEAEAHPPREPSPHPRNRICNNALLAGSSAASALPIGSASVKEIFGAAGDTPTEYAVTVKVAAGGATDPAAYYYYEGNLSAAPAADGLGNSGGIAQNVCYGCHTSSPDYSGQEQFFTIVRQ